MMGHEAGSSNQGVLLREVTEEDLDVFFEQQQDPEANYMAAFTPVDPGDREAFDRRWARILGDNSITVRTIVYGGQVAGSVSSFEQFGEREVSYWLGRAYWGRGIATRALSEFLGQLAVRPLYARAAKDNIASVRVLEKCGFRVVGEDKGFANARGEETEEYILILEG
jgi:RimJ/RimL family protein N-acetyltransferase